MKSNKSAKPDFSMPSNSEVLSKLKSFMPSFKEDTDQLLHDPKRLENECMENIKDGDANIVELNLALGVYDVKPEDEVKLEKILEKDRIKKLPDVVIPDTKKMKNKKKRKIIEINK